jgi:hypothetical protein
MYPIPPRTLSPLFSSAFKIRYQSLVQMALYFRVDRLHVGLIGRRSEKANQLSLGFPEWLMFNVRAACMALLSTSELHVEVRDSDSGDGYA